MREYYPRKLLGPLKSGMGRGLRPSVASLVERTPAARPLLSVGCASGSTSGTASRGGWAAEILIILPRDFGSSYLFACNDTRQWGLRCSLLSPFAYLPLSVTTLQALETLSGVSSLQVNTAVLSAQAARSFEVWDGTWPPSVGGTLPYSSFPLVCR